jgi:hypothetical protein
VTHLGVRCRVSNIFTTILSHIAYAGLVSSPLFILNKCPGYCPRKYRCKWRGYSATGLSNVARTSTRSLCPWRCYFIDFEFSVRISDGANTEDIAVASQPLEKYDRYLVAPEATGSANYNPFPADIYQLGYTLLEWFDVRVAPLIKPCD